MPTYSIYPSADGYVAVGAIEPPFRDRPLELLGTAGDRPGIAASLVWPPRQDP